MSTPVPEKGSFKPLVVDGFPCGGLLFHAICNHIPLRIPFLRTADHDQIGGILGQTCRVGVKRLHGVEVGFGAIGGHIPLVAPLVGAVIQGGKKEVTNNSGNFFKVVKPLSALIHAVFDHVKLTAPFLGALRLNAWSVVSRLPDLCGSGESQQGQSGGGREWPAKNHEEIPFEKHWRVTNGASNQVAMQVLVVRDSTAGGDLLITCRADRGQARLQHVAPISSLLNFGCVGAIRAAHPLFQGAAHG